MENSDDSVLYLGVTNFRNSNIRFGIKQQDRFMHMYILGRTGTGKTTLLEQMIMQDIQAGRGVCFIDAHGDAVKRLEQAVPFNRRNELIYLDITTPNQPYRYNPMRRVIPEQRALVASGIIEVFKKLWADSKGWGIKLEHILRYTILALLDYPKTTLSDIRKMLLDKSFRYDVLQHVTNEEVLLFWKKEFPRYLYNEILPVLNKIGAMLAYPALKRVLVENTEELSLRKIMDERMILLVNVAKGIVGTDTCELLGSLLLSSIASAGFSRASIEESSRVPFFVYVDECQNFATLSWVNMLSELRKYKLGLVFANQYMRQLEPKISDAILGNVGSIISFRVDIHDAAILSKIMYPVFEVEDFCSLPNYHIYLSIMIDGKPSKCFSGYSHVAIKD